MSEPINLNRARKAKAKSDKEARAAANRAKFGRTKAERTAERLAQDKAQKTLDDHKRER